MSTFIPRLSQDGIEQNDYYYSNNPFYQSGYGLPNCTCYAWGRFWECQGAGGARPKLSLGNAENWWGYTSDGYQRGQTPKVGAVICWRKGVAGDSSDGAGHVGIVEAVNDDGTIVTSESAYNGYFFRTKTRNPTVNWDGGDYIFQGFIYNPLYTDSPSATNWVSKNDWLTTAEMENNALMVWQYFGSRGWTREAVSAMLGNMQTESNINPGIWEGLSEYSGGYGLVQWTPYTKYSEWAGAGWQDNGDRECERIQYEVDNGLQWFRNPAAPIVEPPISFKEFTQSTADVETLANYFLWYYEHPHVTIQSNRAEQAVRWYEFLFGITPTPTKKRKMPLWMYLRYI